MDGTIYHVFCLDTGKCYVGQTTQRMEVRWRQHLKSAKGSSRCPFVRALQKYGSDRFVLTVLFSGLQDQASLDDAEIYWGTYFRSLVPEGYNLRLGKGRGIVSEELKRWTSVAVRDSPRAIAQREALHNDLEVRERRRRSLLVSPKMKALGRMNQMRQSVPIMDVTDEIPVYYQSASQASRVLDMSQGNISAVVKGRLKHSGGRRFRRATHREIDLHSQQEGKVEGCDDRAGS
jgi:group I intron endonuclease